MSARRPLLLPLVPLYGAALALKRALTTDGTAFLAHPVISVGSLSAGGAGKTPVVAALATALLRAGYSVDVLSRGYGRETKAIEQVDPLGTAQRYGDEPLLLAQQTGAPVYVGADRHAAGLLAEKNAPHPESLIHLLDDGFQHRRLARALDLVLLTREDVADHLLPAGNLREPLHRLRAAGAVLVREEEESELRPLIEQLAGPAMPIWIIQRELSLDDAPKRPLAFCGIARPENFFAMLRDHGVSPVRTIAFEDHHRYTFRDLTRLIKEAQAAGSDGVVTTEKDAVKLTKAMRQTLKAAGPLTVARLSVHLNGEAGIIAHIGAAARLGRTVRR